MHRGGAVRRLLVSAVVCGAAMLGARTSPSTVAHAAGVAAAASPHLSPAAQGFRLGTAGRPFAWSTAVGDLNADGRPDVAVADRIGRRADGFAYSVELSIAGGATQSVAFDSDQDALEVALRDVDHDRDLDVVVTGTVSRSVVAVWLNDGTGQFQRADTVTLGSDWRSSSSDLTGRTAGDAAAVEALPRHGQPGLAAERLGGHITLPAFPLANCGAFRTARASLSALRPRAPPLA